MINYLRGISQNKRTVEILFALLLLTLPFGSFFLYFSIGFMTIYPYLILVGVICILGLFRLKEINGKLEKWFLIFLSFWFLYALAFVPFVEGIPDAIIDMRSLFMMLISSFAFVITRNILGYERWKEIVLFMFKLFFLLLVFFSFFEMLSGIHFTGNFSQLLVDRAVIDQLVYTPVYLFDNPNNVVSYLFLTGLIIVILEPEGEQKIWLRWFILVCCFIVAYVSYARLGNIIFLSLVICFLGVDIYRYIQLKLKSKLLFALVMFAMLTTVFLQQDKFFGPIWSKENKLKSMNELNGLMSFESLYEKGEKDKRIKSTFKGENVNYNSGQIRVALILNGLYFVKQSKFLGVGPGQFRHKHQIDDKQYYTSTNNGPHFWFIEIVSQYGVLIFGCYLLFLVWIFVIAIRNWKKSYLVAFNLIIGLAVFTASSVLTSGFLILDINWIFLVILVIVASQFSKSQKVLK